jgi:TetR/AcrR family transcriptional regulator, transcriptional repressor for nem operon
MTDTKDYIIDQAYRLFLTKNYEAVSISDISKAIGLTKGALYHHFLNKEDLFKAVIDKFLRTLTLGELKPEISLKELITELVDHARHIVESIHETPSQFVPVNYLSLIIDAFRHYPGYEKENLQWFSKETARMRVVIDNAVKTGEIRSDVNTEHLGPIFFSISLGIATNLIQYQSTGPIVEAYQQQLNEFYNLLKK